MFAMLPISRRRLGVVASLFVLAVWGCSRSVTPAVEDAQLLVRVKTAIVNDEILGPREIGVETRSGTVHLTGVVQSEDEIRQAVTLARSVSGVRDVTSALAVAPAATTNTVTRRFRPDRTGGATEARAWPSVVALGASLGVSLPGESFDTGISGGPLITFRPGRGLGVAIGFSWYRGDMPTGTENESFGKLRIRPFMGGVSYTLIRDRLSVSPAVVAGLAFNSLSINDTLESNLRPVDVDNSLAARLGVGVQYRLNRRFTLTGFAGRLFAHPNVTFIDSGSIFTRRVTADTTLVNMGFAFWLF